MSISHFCQPIPNSGSSAENTKEQLICEDSAHLDSFLDGNNNFLRIQRVTSGNSDAGRDSLYQNEASSNYSPNYGSHPASELWHGIGAHQYYSPFDDKEPNNALFDNSSFVDVDSSYHRSTRRQSKLTVFDDDPFYRPPVSPPRDLHLSDYRGICPPETGLPRSTCNPSYRRSYSLLLDFAILFLSPFRNGIIICLKILSIRLGFLCHRRMYLNRYCHEFRFIRVLYIVIQNRVKDMLQLLVVLAPSNQKESRYEAQKLFRQERIILMHSLEHGCVLSI